MTNNFLFVLSEKRQMGNMTRTAMHVYSMQIVLSATEQTLFATVFNIGCSHGNKFL